MNAIFGLARINRAKRAKETVLLAIKSNSVLTPLPTTIPVSTRTITILDNDDDQTANIDILPAIEGGQAQIEVTLDFAPKVAAEYEYFTRNNTADDNDYINKSGKIIFNPGETKKTILIDLIDDDIKEQSESFDFVLSHPVIGPNNPFSALAKANNIEVWADVIPKV